LVQFSGCLFLFTVGPGGKIFYNVMAANGAWGGWTAIPDGETHETPAVVVFNNVLHMFVRGVHNQIYEKTLTQQWSPWHEVGGQGLTPSAPAATVFNGQLHLIVRGMDDGLFSNVNTGSGFGTWAKLPGGGLTHNTPAVVNHNNRLRVFVRGNDNKIYVDSRDGYTDWSGWREVPGGGLTSSAPAATVTPAGDTVILYVRGLDDAVWRLTIRGDLETSTWVKTAGNTHHGPAVALA